MLPRLIAVAKWVGLPGYVMLLCAKGFHEQPWYTEVVIPLVASLTFVWVADKASRGIHGVVGAVFNIGVADPRLVESGRSAVAASGASACAAGV